MYFFFPFNQKVTLWILLSVGRKILSVFFYILSKLLVMLGLESQIRIQIKSVFPKSIWLIF